MLAANSPDCLHNLQEQWAGASKMRDRMKMLLAATFTGGAFTGPALGGIVYNLPLLLAYDVLGQVLRALRDQGEFECKSNFLGPLVEASKTRIPWIDWQKIRTGVDLRNAVAHDGALHEARVCWDAMEAVESQLFSWGIIPAA